MIDYQPIWDEVISRFRLGPRSIHGYHHWKRVEADAVEIGGAHNANVDVARLFAVLHDSRRWDDNHDPKHGIRAAEYATEMRGRLFNLDDSSFDLLYKACAGHADGYVSEDPTIGACWDADRLDLWRVGITPTPTLFSTDAGRRLLECRAKDPYWPRSLR